jgi:hypothetical protein
LGLLSITLPTLGDPNSTEDVDLRNALSLIQTLLNGNIDSANITDGSIQIGDLLPKIVYGVVNGSTGAILIAGSGGWSSSRAAAGQYTVTFSPVFSALPIIIPAAQIASTATFIMTAAAANQFTTSSFTVSGSPAAIDANMHFIAIGAR